jgi:hypothetical protein
LGISAVFFQGTEIWIIPNLVGVPPSIFVIMKIEAILVIVSRAKEGALLGLESVEIEVLFG